MHVVHLEEEEEEEEEEEAVAGGSNSTVAVGCGPDGNIQRSLAFRVN